MVERAKGMNPIVLRWAREQSGFSVEEVAELMKKPVEAIEAWEAGEGVPPTFRQLQRLAEKIYKRPVALFFFTHPPEERNVKREFRTLPSDEFEALDPDTRYALREATALQQSIRQLTDGENPADRRILRDLAAEPEEPADALAARVRKYLQIPVDIQRRWRNAEESFKKWRQTVEDVGVFVFKRAFRQREVSGFCLHDVEFPVIYINNSNAHSRQSFTLFHELAHLLFAVSGITRENDVYVERLGGVDREIEMTCNRFASELLLPEAFFPWRAVEEADDLRAVVSDTARQFGVSRESVLRRLLDAGLVGRRTYEEWSEEWNAQFLQQRKRRSGGNYYATQATYLGDTYLNLAFTAYWSGRLTTPELADHLRVKARNLGKLEEFYLRTR